MAQTLINQGYNAIDLFILIWVDFKLSLFKKEKKRGEKKALLFTVTEFNKNLLDSKRLPYCFCFGVENVILVLFLEGEKIPCCYQSYAYGKMIFFNTWWLTYFRSINGIINKHFANLKCEIWIIIKTHLSTELSVPRLDVDHGGGVDISLMNILLLFPITSTHLKPNPHSQSCSPLKRFLPGNEFLGAEVHFCFYLCRLETD